MSRSDAEVWPWMLAAGVFGGGMLVALAALSRGGVASLPSPRGSAPPPRAQGEPYSTLDVEAAARMLASENPRGSERLHVEQIWTQIRSRKPADLSPHLFLIFLAKLYDPKSDRLKEIV